MSRMCRVVVEGGGHNLYYIRERDGSYAIFQHIVHIIWDDDNHVGEENSLDDALDRIRSHSGEDIDNYD